MTSVGSIYAADDGAWQKEFGTILEKNNISLLITRGHAPFVERTIRTINKMIFLRQENADMNKPWHDYLLAVLKTVTRVCVLHHLFRKTTLQNLKT